MTRKQPEYHSSRAPVSFASKKEALDALAELDHGFCTESFTLGVCSTFGVNPLLESAIVDSQANKGLNNAWDDHGHPLSDGTRIFGCAADTLAVHLCRELRISYLPMQGRGSQLRTAITALRGAHGV